MPAFRWNSPLLMLAVAAGAAVASPTSGTAEPGSEARDGTNPGVLVLGRVSNNPRKDYPGLKQLADYLAAALAAHGIEEGSVQFAGDNEEMVDMLRAGTVDVAFDTVFPALTYEQEAAARPVLREWRDGAPTYRSILFKRRDTPIDGVSDLVGRTVAFERPGSTSAYMIPRAEIVAAGLRLSELPAPKMRPAAGTVGYVFAGSENNLVVWVHRGLVDAGAFSDIDWEQSDDMPPELKDDFEIFFWSAPLPRALVVLRPGLPSDLGDAVSQALLAAPTDPTGAAALKAKRVARYDELTGQAAEGVAAARRLIALSH